jgi:hypothetical protein
VITWSLEKKLEDVVEDRKTWRGGNSFFYRQRSAPYPIKLDRNGEVRDLREDPVSLGFEGIFK